MGSQKKLPSKINKLMEETDDNKTYKVGLRMKLGQEDGRCILCPLHGGENVFRNYRKHGVKKSRKKNKRRQKQ